MTRRLVGIGVAVFLGAVLVALISTHMGDAVNFVAWILLKWMWILAPTANVTRRLFELAFGN
jgi:hypothetical protein